MFIPKRTEILAWLFMFCSVTIFFLRDDFENDRIGAKPKNWDDPGDQLLKVIKDPEGESGNVLEQKGEGNGEGIPIPLGTKPKDAGWTDYIVEWDWWWGCRHLGSVSLALSRPNRKFYFYAQR